MRNYKKNNLLIFLFILIIKPKNSIPISSEITELKIEKTNSSQINDVTANIDDVQKMLEEDPTLPRLTKGEIKDLFEEVAAEEYVKSVKSGDIEKARDMKSLMVVLPYKPNDNSSAELEELYSRPPITKLIRTEAKKKQDIIHKSSFKKFEDISITRKETKPIHNYRITQNVKNSTRLSSKFKPLLKNFTFPAIIKNAISLKQVKSTNDVYNNNNNNNNFRINKINITTPNSNLVPQLEDILDNLGLTAESPSKKRFKLDIPNNDTINPILKTVSNNNKPLFYNEFKPLPTIDLIAEDLKIDLLPNLTAHDFGNFKPIPISKYSARSINPDLENYLIKFGIVDNPNNRSQKSKKYRNDNENKEFNRRIDNNYNEDDTQIIDKQRNDAEDYKKLEQLLATLIELKSINISLTENEIKRLSLQNYNLSTSLLDEGPSPIETIDLDLMKNEIKRQSDSLEPTRYNLRLNNTEGSDIIETNNQTNIDPISLEEENESKNFITENNTILNDLTKETELTTTVTTSTTTTTTAASTTLEQPRISDLGDSFSGGLGPETASDLPLQRKNGFYFLADLHSFLEVGDDKDKVVVRLDHKIGDSRQFLPVTVP